MYEGKKNEYTETQYPRSTYWIISTPADDQTPMLFAQIMDKGKKIKYGNKGIPDPNNLYSRWW